MNELSKINQEFNDSIDDSFSLTKMFEKNELFSKTVNMILTLSIAFGAMKGLSENITKFDNPSQHYALVKEAQTSFNNITVITKDNIKDIANTQEDNIYQVNGNNQFIVAAYEETFEIQETHKNNLINELIDINNVDIGSSPHATYGDTINNTGVPISELLNFSFREQDRSDIGYLVLKKDYFKNNFSEDDKLRYPLMLENENLYLFAHELNHVTEDQFQYDKNYKEKGDTVLSNVLAQEISSDVFAASVIISTNDYDLEKSTKLLSEMSDRRQHYLSNYNDFEHSTHLGINVLIEAINENPSILDQIKGASINKLSDLSMNFGKNVFNSINEFYRSKEAFTEIADPDIAQFILLSSYEPSLHDKAVFKIGVIKDLNQHDGFSIDEQEASLLARLEAKNLTNNDNEPTFENINKITKPKM